MTGSSSDKPSVGLFVDWNNTASPGGINKAILAAHGGDFSVTKRMFDASWDAGGWQRFRLRPPLVEGKDVNSEKGALKRWARANSLFELQKAGHPAAPPISVDEMYDFGKRVQTYPGFDSMLVEIKDRVLRVTGKTLHIAVVTNAWAPVIRGTDIVRSGIIDQVVGQEFMPYLTEDGRVLAQPTGGVGEETKPLAIRFVASQERFSFIPGPIPDGSRVMPPPRELVPSIPKHARIALANGFSDKYMIDAIAADDGVMVGVINSDYVHLGPRLFYDFEYRSQVRKYSAEDRQILDQKLQADRLSAVLTASYDPLTREGQRTRSELARFVELVAKYDEPNLAHRIIRGQVRDPGLAGSRSIADNFGKLGA